MRGARRRVAAVCSLALLALLGACSSCPPEWAESTTLSEGFHYAAASAGPVFVDAESVDLALTRAARRLADVLGLDVERRLSVSLRDGRLFVEAWGPEGPLDRLQGLELVALARCGERTHARVRLEQR